MIKLHTGLITKRGGSKTNQDYCGFLELRDGACWVVADGLGGHIGGEIASRLAVETILASFRKNPELSPKALENHVLAAHNRIVCRQREEPMLKAMRTTVVLLVSDYRSFLCAHAGDSRLYFFHGASMQFQTKDHSVPQAMYDAGDNSADHIRRHRDRNKLLRSLGGEDQPRPFISNKKRRLYKGDAFLLCVDGFWEHIFEAEMEADLAKENDPQEWLKRMETRIIRRAESDCDNYTAIAVLSSGASPPPQPPYSARKRTLTPHLSSTRVTTNRKRNAL